MDRKVVDSDLKLSAFVLTTNNIKNQFPFIESIKSWLPVLDELVVVDGGSTDGTREAIEAIGDPKIRIVCDESTKWEDNWTYSRMGKNFNRGLQECTGNIVLKFDADYILHPKGYGPAEKGKRTVRGDCLFALYHDKLTLSFNRFNFILKDRYFIKSTKTLGINTELAKKEKHSIKYGLDIENWSWGYDFIIEKSYEHGIYFGSMVRNTGNCYLPCATVFNYDYMFSTEEVAKNTRFRHHRAIVRQKELKYKTVDIKPDSEVPLTDEELRLQAWDLYKNDQVAGNMRRAQNKINISQHPLIIQDKINKLPADRQGHSCWGWY